MVDVKEIICLNEESNLKESLNDKSLYVASFYRFYPDLLLDLMTPKESKRRLNLYQRVLMRAIFRFHQVYTVVTRSSSKSFIQLLSYMLMGIMYPGIQLSILAETKEQSASIMGDKYSELCEWFPFLKEEVAEKSFQRDIAIIIFHNGSKISNLGNNQRAKGKILPLCKEIYIRKLEEPRNLGCVA